MLKVWFVIYSGVYIGGTIGPLPYDMNECQWRAAQKNLEWQNSIVNGTTLTGQPAPPELIAKVSKLRFGCVEAVERPRNNVPDDGDL